MKTLLLVIIVLAILLTPIILVIRHFAKDETEKLQKALREEQEAWTRMKRVMENDVQHMRDYGLYGRSDKHDQ